MHTDGGLKVRTPSFVHRFVTRFATWDYLPLSVSIGVHPWLIVFQLDETT